MRFAALLFVAALTLGMHPMRAQETQAEPTPAIPAAPKSSTPKQTDGQTNGSQQTPAPVEHRATKPSAVSSEPVEGPLKAGPGAAQGSVPQPARQSRNGGGEVGTIRVETRLVNLPVNVVDAHGAPVGGLQKQDFRIFEDGKEQTIAVFDRESSSPLSIVLAIDASETVMTSERLEREAAKRFVRGILRQQDELDLMQFADSVREIVPFTNQAKRVEDGLSEIQRGEATALYDAVYLASDQLAKTRQDAGRRRVIVLISDGGDTAKHSLYTQALEEAQRAGAIIYSIIIVPIVADAGRNTGGEHALIQMSEDTGGKYYYVEDPKDLEPAFRHVSEDLRTQYLLSYYAPQKSGDSSFRRIKVTLTETTLAGKDSLRYRSGYFADAR